MPVVIANYRVLPASRLVDVDLRIELPTGEVNSTIVASEATLDTAARAAGRQTWDERDLVTVVSSVFSSLANTVKVDGA